MAPPSVAVDNGRVAGLALGPVLLGVLVLAATLRWFGYTGFMGSDEVIYLQSAFRILDGDWTVDRYVGASRLGVNLPMAGFGWLLGRGELAAAAYGYLASLAEVGLVVYVAHRMFGGRVALFAGLLIASLPGHVHTAGRIVADPALCLAITGAFVLFFEGERRNWPLGYFLAGLCAGFSFWVKPVTMFVFGVLLAYPLIVRRWNSQWLWMGLGVLLAMAANGALMAALTGDFWFVFETIRERRQSGYLEQGIGAGGMADDPYYYLIFLFAKLYHTGLLGPLALLGVAALARPRRQPEGRLGAGFLLLWGVGLLLILSLLPVSLRPLIFVPKQTNYMLIFVAPFCVMGGYALSRLPARLGHAAAATAVATGIVFAMLLQASITVFTANSFATLSYIQNHPTAGFHVMTNAAQAAAFQQQIGGADLTPRLLESTKALVQGSVAPLQGAMTERLAVVDEQTFRWDGSRPFARPQDIPTCWESVEEIRGTAQGAGVWLLHHVALPAARALPAWGSGLVAKLQALADPAPARVYRVPPTGC